MGSGLFPIPTATTMSPPNAIAMITQAKPADCSTPSAAARPLAAMSIAAGQIIIMFGKTFFDKWMFNLNGYKARYINIRATRTRVGAPS